MRTPAAGAAATAVWAPFTFDVAYAPGTMLHFVEDRLKLRGVLPAASLAGPFRWTFGDGAASDGFDAAHRYIRTGWYAVQVQFYDPRRKLWSYFDNARVRIVAVAALGRANSGTRSLQVRDIVISVLVYASLALIVGIPLVRRLRSERRAG